MKLIKIQKKIQKKHVFFFVLIDNGYIKSTKYSSYIHYIFIIYIILLYIIIYYICVYISYCIKLKMIIK